MLSSIKKKERELITFHSLCRFSRTPSENLVRQISHLITCGFFTDSLPKSTIKLLELLSNFRCIIFNFLLHRKDIFALKLKGIFQSFADSSKFSARQFDPAIDVNEKIMFLIVEVLFGRFPPRKIRETSNRRSSSKLSSHKNVPD